MTNIARVFSAELEGIQARAIEVEIDLNIGLHAFNIVGLADKALNEAEERVNSALKSSGAKPPNRENRKITVNLAPADIRKTGSQYDLAIALGYLLATRQIAPFDTRDKIFVGELALDGRLRPINGALNIAEMAARHGFKMIFLPRANANEASAIPDIRVIPLDQLPDAMAMLQGKREIKAYPFQVQSASREYGTDFSDIRGQMNAKRALMIAASGRHNLLMIGPPGSGKTALAQALPGILPPLTLKEAIEVTKVWSAAGRQLGGLVAERPFRMPHQTASLAAIIGGGREPRPGEVSLAHHGVLFLDELPEFPKHILEALRGPLESGAVNVARGQGSLKFPAAFSLIAAMNPCPCGFYADSRQACACNAYEVTRYRKRISGPLLDRMDMQVEVPRVPLSSLGNPRPEGNESVAIKKRVGAVRILQSKRFQNIRLGLFTNADMTSREAESMACLSTRARVFLRAIQKTSLSPRGYYRLLKTARTIADLENEEEISEANLAEAWSYRLRTD